MSRNIGTALMVQLATKLYGVLATIPSAGRKPRSQAMPPKDTAIRASATGTRSTSSASRTPTPQNPTSTLMPIHPRQGAEPCR
jgi:hypothetical protein